MEVGGGKRDEGRWRRDEKKLRRAEAEKVRRKEGRDRVRIFGDAHKIITFPINRRFLRSGGRTC